jgi:hypothetical protein
MEAKQVKNSIKEDKRNFCISVQNISLPFLFILAFGAKAEESVLVITLINYGCLTLITCHKIE